MNEQNQVKTASGGSVHRIIKRLTKFEKVRFILVGGFNTVVDFAILIILASFVGIPTSTANIISTSVALFVSYALNKKAVFGNTNTNNRRQFILFVVITLFGLWVLQTIVIMLTLSLLSSWLDLSATSTIVLIAAKLLATLVSLTWNYLWYSRVIFSQKKPIKQ